MISQSVQSIIWGNQCRNVSNKKFSIHLKKRVTSPTILYDTNFVIVHRFGWKVPKSHLGSVLLKHLVLLARLLSQLCKSGRELLLFVCKNRVVPSNAYLACYFVQHFIRTPTFSVAVTVLATLEITWSGTSKIRKDSNSRMPSKILLMINSFISP